MATDPFPDLDPRALDADPCPDPTYDADPIGFGSIYLLATAVELKSNRTQKSRVSNQGFDSDPHSIEFC